MKYELIKNSNVGVIIDPTPVLRDIKETFEISFVLPDEGAYIALFRDEDNSEHKAIVKNCMATVPKELLKKEQRLGLTVCLMDGDSIKHAWECHSLKVGAFLYLRQTQWQITAGLDDRELFARLADLERIHANTLTEFEALKTEFADLKQKQAEFMARISDVTNSLIRFAFKDYSDNVFLSGGSFEDFLKEFGFNLTEDEINALKGEKKDE